MFKAATSMTRKPYSREKGRQIASSLIENLGHNPSACWLFCEPDAGMDGLVAGINEVVGTKNVIGCTTDGEISSSGFSTGSAVLGGIAGNAVRFEIAGVENLSKDSEQAGRQLAYKLPRSSRHVQLLSDGLTGNGSAILRGVHSVLGPNVVVTGGTAGDARKFQKTWQFLGDKILTDTAVAISFCGDLSVGTGVRTGWFRMGISRKVTRARGNVVYEMDGQPALEIYRKYLGPLADKLPAVGVQFPLGVVDQKGELDREEPILRAVMAIDDREGSVTFAGEIPQGSTVVLTGGGSHDKLLDASAEAAGIAANCLRSPYQPAMTFVYSCMARKIILGPRTCEETDRISRTVGSGIPTLGFYTYGEFCPSQPGRPCELHNETATVTVLGIPRAAR